MISDSSLQEVDNHWAVQALGEESRNRGLEIANYKLVKNALGQVMDINFDADPSDEHLLERLALAYEMAAIEGISTLLNPSDDNEKLRNQCIAGAHRAFEIQRLFTLPENEVKRIFSVLHLSSLAYCGDRWSDLRRWLNEHESEIIVPSVAHADWDKRILYRLFECWLRLFRKKRWDDLDRIREIIAGLREDQRIFESNILANESDISNRAMAFRLIALYHWAKSTEILAIYMLQGEPVDITTNLDKHFESGINAASAASDAQLEVILRWLHVASRQMVSASI